MQDEERLERIRQNIDRITSDDARFLLNLVATLEKKNGLLSHHVMELTEELENVKMDFGGGSR